MNTENKKVSNILLLFFIEVMLLRIGKVGDASAAALPGHTGDYTSTYCWFKDAEHMSQPLASKNLRISWPGLIGVISKGQKGSLSYKTCE
jgi:hypothetical protein